MTELETKLREILITAYENGLLEEPARGFIENHLVAQIKQAAREHAQTEKAYGGCRICYGKGYATVNGRWSGYDTDQDIGSPGGYISGGKPIEMKYCTCDRGKQLSSLVKTMLLRSEAEVEHAETVDRIEVIDGAGRAYVKGSIYGSPISIELSYQDDNRTLKVFVTELQTQKGKELLDD